MLQDRRQPRLLPRWGGPRAGAAKRRRMLGRLRRLLRRPVVVQRTTALYPSSQALQGRTALVTGASGGIGAAVARALAGQGARVLGQGRDPGRLGRLSDELGPRFAAVPGELTRAGLEPLLQRLASERLDILVHSAGLQRIGDADAMPPADWDETLDVNLRAAWMLTRAVLPGMKERRSGDLVHLSSVMSRTTAPGQTAYCASKWGLDGMLGALRQEVSGHRIRVTHVHPGRVATGIRGGADEWDARSLQPEDVARVVVFVVTQPEYVSLGEIHMASVDELGGFR